MGSRSGYIAFLSLSVAFLGNTFAQTVPMAPDVPTCTMKDGKSTCEFKQVMSGTPTSVVGNRVILYTKGTSGGHANSRTFNADALKRLADRYKFTATVTEDPTIFTAANLATTKVVIMSNGDGDVIPTGANRNALQDFQQVSGWGVIWVHAACAFITSGWTYGQQSCVQQYLHHNPSGTARKIFLDSGTTASPNHGLKNPQSEFMMRNPSGWAGSRNLALSDEFYCFQAPARNTAGVNVLLGYDRSGGLPVADCPNATDASVTGSQNHNLAWTHMMGKGISIYNSIGHDVGTYTGASNMGDSLLWRFIRYAAKDWEVAGPTTFIADTRDMIDQSQSSGTFALTFTDAGRNDVRVSDLTGKQVFSRTYNGVTRAEVPDLKRGIYFVKVASSKRSEVKKVRIF